MNFHEIFPPPKKTLYTIPYGSKDFLETYLKSIDTKQLRLDRDCIPIMIPIVRSENIPILPIKNPHHIHIERGGPQR